MTDVKKQLGKRIKELRKQREMAQEKLAELIGIEPNNVSRIENGKNYPSPENIAKIATALNVNLSQLFAFEHYKPCCEMKAQLIEAMEDEDLTRLLFKFYSTIAL